MGGSWRAAGGVAAAAASLQTGAAIGTTVFPLVGPPGVVALRQIVTALVLLPIARPRLRALPRGALPAAAALGAVLVVMNLAIYEAIERVGLAPAVTIEFVGPLVLALLASRRRFDLGVGALALVGVAVVTGVLGTRITDPIGVLLAAGAAVAWAAYILLNRRVGGLLPGVGGTALASGVGALLTLPVLVVALLGVPADALPRVLLIGAVTGVLSSALPYSLDLLLLRTTPREVFGMLQSLHPLAAVVAGLVVLGQALTPWQLGGIVLVCVANVLALLPRPAPAVAVEPVP